MMHRLLGVAAVWVFVAPCSSRAEDPISPEQTLDAAIVQLDSLSARSVDPPKPAPESRLDAKVLKALAVVKEEREKQKAFSGNVAFGLDGDEATQGRPVPGINAAEPQSLFKIGADFELQKGSYPHELRVSSSASVQLKDKEVTEEITKILGNYDFHFNPWLETYAFMERFADSYLSIRQRYEAGTGLKASGFLFLTPEGAKRQKALHDVCDLLSGPIEKDDAAIAAALVTSSSPRVDIGPADTKAVKTLLKSACSKGDIRTASRQRYARVELGMALTFMWELEQPSFSVNLEPADPTSTTPARPLEIKPDASDRWRAVLRPSLVLRLTDNLKLTASAYFKLPLGESRQYYLDRERNQHSRLDWRLDSYTTAELALGESSSIKLGWDWHFDNAPPSISSSILLGEERERMLVDSPMARGRHSRVSLKVKVSL